MGRLRQYSQRPYDDSINDQTGNFLDWVQSTLNALVQQNISGTGFPALSQPQLDPTTGQFKSVGSRASSLTTNFTFTATTTSISIFWDGTNLSQLLRIYRDDGSISGPFSGNQLITGLSPNTKYFFYLFFDESTQTVRFVSQPGATQNPVGNPPVAFPGTDILIAQQQQLRGHIPLAANLALNGITTPNVGTTPSTNLGGGGGGIGGYLSVNIR